MARVRPARSISCADGCDVRAIADKIIAMTGGSGSIRRALPRRVFALSPRAVRLLVRSESAASLVSAVSHPDCPIFQSGGDLDDSPDLRCLFEGADVAIHLAAQKDMVRGEEDPAATVHTNVEAPRP